MWAHRAGGIWRFPGGVDTVAGRIRHRGYVDALRNTEMARACTSTRTSTTIVVDLAHLERERQHSQMPACRLVLRQHSSSSGIDARFWHVIE